MASTEAIPPIQLPMTLTTSTSRPARVAGIAYHGNFEAQDMRTSNDNQKSLEMSANLQEFDDIIEKIEKLRLAQDYKKRLYHYSETDLLNGNLNKEYDADDSHLLKTTLVQIKAPSSNALLGSSEFRNDEDNDDLCKLQISPQRSWAKDCPMNIIDRRHEDNATDRKRINEESDNIENGNKDKDNNGLVERGPIRDFHNPPRTLPYSTINFSTLSFTASISNALDSTAEKILSHKEYSDKLRPCLDKLSGFSRILQVPQNLDENLCVSPNGLKINGSGYMTNADQSAVTDTTRPTNNLYEQPSLPSIIVNDPGEDSLLEMLASGTFQAAEVPSTANNASGSSPISNSPMSNHNTAPSRSNSRASSRAQSPGYGLNFGSPMMHNNLASSPVGSPQITSSYRIPPGLSSSSSSNQSYCDTPSPTGYQTSVSQQIEERLDRELEQFTTWKSSCDSSATVVNSTEAPGDTIDSNELQLVLQVLKDLDGKYENVEDSVQVVPNATISTLDDYQYENNSPEIEPMASCNIVSASKETPLTALNFDRMNPMSGSEQYQTGTLNRLHNTAYRMHIDHRKLRDVATHNSGSSIGNGQPNSFECSNFSNCTQDYTQCMPGCVQRYYEPEVSLGNVLDYTRKFDGRPVPGTMGIIESTAKDKRRNLSEKNSATRTDHLKNTPPKSTFSGFHIPETVCSFTSTSSRRNSVKNIVPWPSLDLPSTKASQRLMEVTDPVDVRKAMTNLLKKPIEELSKPDEDGDTMLMCLVGNPDELARKKAYLAPLVERLGSVEGKLFVKNNRGEDALYLAAMNCPHMAYVAGYLAATMLQRGIDISQRLYHTRGDTLIHSVAARGDTHGQVLAELLSLKTPQGNAVFDLSKCNYDGRTALHVAVESHNPMGRGVKSIATVRLLLENGADPKIKEPKCGDTALHMAVSLSCDPFLVKVLLDKSGSESVNATNYLSNTALHMAAASSKNVSLDVQKEICWHLINAGAQSNIQNRQGKTPLALVSSERKEAIKKIFYRK